MRKAKPQKFRDRWRIRWYDERGVRRSECMMTYRSAMTALRNRLREVELKTELENQRRIKTLQQQVDKESAHG